MWLGVLLSAVAWSQDTPDLGFAAEYLGVATSAAVARGSGVVLELQGQSLVLPGAVPPDGVDVLPLLPRLAIGGTGGDRTRWAAGVHGTGLVPLGGDDLGGGGGTFASVAFGSRGVWTGFELDGVYATLVGEPSLSHVAVTASTTLAGDVDRTTTLFLRFGGAVTSSIGPDLTGDPVFEPRAGLGVGYRPHPSAVLGLALHLAIRDADPRVPWTGVLALAWRFGPTLVEPEPAPLVVTPAIPQQPLVKEVTHPLLQCEAGAIATGSPPPYGKEAWCVVVTEDNRVLRQGPYLRWHDAKVIAERGQYAEGRRAGEWSVYSGSGTLLGQGSYEDDQKHGAWRTWFPNGSIASEGSWWNGLEDGTWTYYSMDGSKVVGFWEAGDREGEWLDYDPVGTVLRKRVFKGGRMMHQEMVTGSP